MLRAETEKLAQTYTTEAQYCRTKRVHTCISIWVKFWSFVEAGGLCTGSDFSESFYTNFYKNYCSVFTLHFIYIFKLPVATFCVPKLRISQYRNNCVSETDMLGLKSSFLSGYIVVSNETTFFVPFQILLFDESSLFFFIFV